MEVLRVQGPEHRESQAPAGRDETQSPTCSGNKLLDTGKKSSAGVIGELVKPGWVCTGESEWVPLGMQKWGGGIFTLLEVFSPWTTSINHREYWQSPEKIFLVGSTGGGNRSCCGKSKKIYLNSPVPSLQNNIFILEEGQQTPSSLVYWCNLTVAGGGKQERKSQPLGKRQNYKLDSGRWIQERTGSPKDGQDHWVGYPLKTQRYSSCVILRLHQNNRGHSPPPPTIRLISMEW